MNLNKLIIHITISVFLVSHLSSFDEKGESPQAKQSVPLVIPRINGMVNLDGLSEEPAWEGICPLRLTQMEPVFGAEPTEQGEILLASDDRYLYLAGRLYDREPEKILSNSKQRDSGNPACEWFGLVVDSFNDNENALAFFTTPAGLRWDATVFNDASGDMPINTTWNTFWEVATVRNQKGWFAEFRIPFSSLRFQDKDGRVVMGIVVWRFIPRKNEYSIFPSISPDWGFWSKFKPSKAQKIELKNIMSRKSLQIAPFFLGGIGHAFALNESGTAFQKNTSTQKVIGLDAKIGLSSNLTLDVTLNPDFAQVEADDQQINMTRFSLFFPEKRLFFQERASVFDFDFESTEQNKLFYSRCIGLQGNQQVPIYGGIRAIGRLGPYDLGFIDMQTAPLDDRPSENFGVLRFKRQILNRNSYIGSMVTSRIGMDGTYNWVFGVDSYIRVLKDDYLTMKWAQSFSSGKGNRLFAMDSSRYCLSWNHPSQRGLGYRITQSEVGEGYDPEVGFQARKDYSHLSTGIWYGWYPGEQSSLFSHRAGVNSFLFMSRQDRAVETFILQPNWDFITKKGYNLNISLRYDHENVRDNFSLSEKVEIPAGEYDYYGIDLRFASPAGRVFDVLLKTHMGSFFDGRRFSYSVNPRLNLFSGLELGIEYEFNQVKFPAREQELSTHISRIRALYMFSIRFSAQAFVQYNNLSDSVSSNFRLRYNPREGVDLYLIYDESLNTDRFLSNLVLPPASGRTLLLKFTYTFNLDWRV